MAESTARIEDILPLSNEQRAAFDRFANDLHAENAHKNYTRVAREDFELRHFIDSLLFQDLIPQGASVLDLGTGPGFPAWPLACARPDLQVVGLDSNAKMIGFAQRHPLPNLNLVVERAEEWLRRGEFDVVTGRALAPLAVSLEISAAFARVGGAVIPMRTAREQEDCRNFAGAATLGLELESMVVRTLTGTDQERLAPIFRKAKNTPREYPRSWSDIKRKPLR